MKVPAHAWDSRPCLFLSAKPMQAEEEWGFSLILSPLQFDEVFRIVSIPRWLSWHGVSIRVQGVNAECPSTLTESRRRASTSTESDAVTDIANITANTNDYFDIILPGLS